MAWEDPSTEVTALRDMMVLCACAAADGLNATGRYHYPQAALTTDDASSADTMPLVVIADTDSGHNPVGEPGAGSLPAGTLTATIHGRLGIGALDRLARAFRSELLLLSTGLAIQRVDCGVCTDPKNAARAAAEDGGSHTQADARAITLTITYGLET